MSRSVETPRTAFRAASRVAMVAAVFVAVVAILMLATHLRLRAAEPLTSPALAELVERHARDPANEALKEQVRALDLLARKAYFTSRWQGSS